MTRAEYWQWSSAAAHMAGKSTPFVDVAPGLERTGDFAAFLAEADDTDPRWSAVLKAEGAGWPVGAKEWLMQLEAKHKCTLTPAKRGPKPKVKLASKAVEPDMFD